MRFAVRSGEVGSEGRGAWRTTSDEAMSRIDQLEDEKGGACAGFAGNRGT